MRGDQLTERRVQPNRADAENCPACEASANAACEFHEGYAAGWRAAAEAAIGALS